MLQWVDGMGTKTTGMELGSERQFDLSHSAQSGVVCSTDQKGEKFKSCTSPPKASGKVDAQDLFHIQPWAWNFWPWQWWKVYKVKQKDPPPLYHGPVCRENNNLVSKLWMIKKSTNYQPKLWPHFCCELVLISLSSYALVWPKESKFHKSSTVQYSTRPQHLL